MRAAFLPSDLVAAVQRDQSAFAALNESMSGAPGAQSPFQNLARGSAGDRSAALYPAPGNTILEGLTGSEAAGATPGDATTGLAGSAVSGSGISGARSLAQVSGSGPLPAIGTSFPGGGGVGAVDLPVDPAPPLPEPETWGMVALGMAIIGLFSRRFRRKETVLN